MFAPIHSVLFRIKYNHEIHPVFYSNAVKDLHSAFQPFPPAAANLVTQSGKGVFYQETTITLSTDTSACTHPHLR